jgi:hypothetical protein
MPKLTVHEKPLAFPYASYLEKLSSGESDYESHDDENCSCTSESIDSNEIEGKSRKGEKSKPTKRMISKADSRRSLKKPVLRDPAKIGHQTQVIKFFADECARRFLEKVTMCFPATAFASLYFREREIDSMLYKIGQHFWKLALSRSGFRGGDESRVHRIFRERMGEHFLSLNTQSCGQPDRKSARRSTKSEVEE